MKNNIKIVCDKCKHGFLLNAVNIKESPIDIGDDIYFSIKDNGIKCATCKTQDKGAIKISYTTYTSLVYILSSEPKKIFSFDIPQESIDELNLVAKIYTFEKLEKEYIVEL